MSFWASRGFATYEWILSPTGGLTVLIASIHEDVQRTFISFAMDHPELTKYPLLFDFVLCTEHLRLLEYEVIHYIHRIESKGVLNVEPDASTDVIKDSQRSSSTIFTLHELVCMVEPLLDRLDKCERLLDQRHDARVWKDLASQFHATARVDLQQLREKHNMCRKKIDNVVGRAQMQLSLVSSLPGQARLQRADIDDY